jgi:hypothetical protein
LLIRATTSSSDVIADPTTVARPVPTEVALTLIAAGMTPTAVDTDRTKDRVKPGRRCHVLNRVLHILGATTRKSSRPSTD